MSTHSEHAKRARVSVPGDVHRMASEAIAQADRRAEAEPGKRFAVFYRQGPDPYGRTGVWYVREADDAEMLAEIDAGRVITWTRTA